MAPFAISAPLCSDLAYALDREWLETDGIGGFASSTVCGVNTRRYHGLLVAALRPPVDRAVLLSKLEATLVVAGQRYELSANQYPGVVHPDGFRHLAQFKLDPFPCFLWQVGEVAIEQSLFLVQGESTLAVQYRLLSPGVAKLEVRPLIAFRGYHSLTHENGAFNAELTTGEGMISLQPYHGLPTVHFSHNGEHVDVSGQWYRNFVYAREQERGLDCEEDLFQPFVLRFSLTQQQPALLLASTGRSSVAEYPALRETEIRRRERFGGNRLIAAASQFLVPRGDSKTVIAGYHWFTDWGRDTMIALPGLTLAAGDYGTARSILRTFAHAVDQGMLPNRFPDGSEAPEYNTVDATLWFFEAVRAFAEAAQDWSFVRSEIYPVLCDIIGWHLKGTRYGIHVDEDGLLLCGEPGVQLTWMDAKVGDWVVTPRMGKPVEIQALWYNAISVALACATRFGDGHSADAFAQLQQRAEQHFLPLFWNEPAGCLFDAVNGEEKDGSFRPNQIFAISLPHPLVTGERAAHILEAVERELLTPFGLRTLSPGDSRYRGRYEGDPRSRDSAYHQGTVWPWLIGPYIDAYLRVRGSGESQKAHCRDILAPLMASLDEAGLGQISEIYDGDAPHRPKGCIAQAWSVGELLRVLAKLN